MSGRSPIALLAGVLISACAGDIVQVSDAPVTIGATPHVFAPTTGIPAHGPRNELTIWLPAGYHEERDSAGYAVYSADHQRVTFHVALVLANGEQRPLRPNGFLSGAHGFAARFYETVPATPGATARGVSAGADPPLDAQRIEWWTGDPGKRCFLCL